MGAGCSLAHRKDQSTIQEKRYHLDPISVCQHANHSDTSGLEFLSWGGGGGGGGGNLPGEGDEVAGLSTKGTDFSLMWGILFGTY